MKKVFYAGVLGLALFEIAKVYFIMRMPGISQQVRSIDLAYFLHQWRWAFRGLFIAMILLGLLSAFFTRRWLLPLLSLLLAGVVAYAANYRMAADAMFLQPKDLRMAGSEANTVATDKLIIGVAHEGEARAYPIQYIGYHHQVRDRIADKDIMVTYCTVCRTGRVFEPVVNGKPETFRLVGMDQFNAMFEDKTTGSWWRQSTGEAVAGPLKGQVLPELPSVQMTLKQWLATYPQSLVMQPDSLFRVKYDSMRTYERGKLTGKLTRRDTASWQDKSWVVGVEIGQVSKAYDWNRLQRERIIHDELDGKPILLLLSQDSLSFAAFERPAPDQRFTWEGDTLRTNGSIYDLFGHALQEGGNDLKRLKAYQEYWHSWRTFHPQTGRY